MTIGGMSDVPWYVVVLLIGGFLVPLYTIGITLNNIERILKRIEDQRNG